MFTEIIAFVPYHLKELIWFLILYLLLLLFVEEVQGVYAILFVVNLINAISIVAEVVGAMQSKTWQICFFGPIRWNKLIGVHFVRINKTKIIIILINKKINSFFYRNF